MDVTEIPTTTLDWLAENVSSTTELIVVEETDCFYEKQFTIFTYTVDDLLLAASMAATICNVMVLFCAVKLYKRSGDTMHLFVFSMTIADLILSVFCHPNELLIRKHEFLQQVHLCAVVSYFNWIGFAASGLSLTLLNVDKLIFFRWPLSYERSMSKKRALYLVGMIWGISIGFVSYCWIFNIVYVFEKDCTLQMTPGYKYYYDVFTVLFCLLPITSSFFVSLYLFALTREKRNAANSSNETHAFRTKVKSLVFIFATTFWTSFSLLPYRIFNLGRIHSFNWASLSCRDRQLFSWIAWILIYLLSLNPIVNPIITSLIYAPYRMTIKKFLVNIPIGNRPLYSQDENTGSDTSLVLRRNRNRRYSSTELASLRQSTEVTRMSLCETPWTPGAKGPAKTESEFTFTKSRDSEEEKKDGKQQLIDETEPGQVLKESKPNDKGIVKEVKFST